MFIAMASQGTIPSEWPGASVFKPTIGSRRYIVPIKIDQVLIRCDPMGIVAGRAGRLLINNVKTVSAIALAGTAECAETLIVENAVTAVAFVTERVICCAFDGLIGCNQPAFQQRRKSGPMRSAGASAASTGPLIIIMTIGALNGGD